MRPWEYSSHSNPSGLPHDLRSVDFRFDSAQHIWTDHDFNSEHPQLSFLDTHHAARIYPLALEDERFHGNKRWRRLEDLPSLGQKEYLARIGKYVLYGTGTLMITSLMLNESLCPGQLAYSMY